MSKIEKPEIVKKYRGKLSCQIPKEERKAYNDVSKKYTRERFAQGFVATCSVLAPIMEFIGKAFLAIVLFFFSMFGVLRKK